MSEGKAPVSALFKTETGYVFAGATMARSKCWSMLKGGLTVKTSGLADLYFEVNIYTHIIKIVYLLHDIVQVLIYSL